MPAHPSIQVLLFHHYWKTSYQIQPNFLCRNPGLFFILPPILLFDPIIKSVLFLWVLWISYDFQIKSRREHRKPTIKAEYRDTVE